MITSPLKQSNQGFVPTHELLDFFTQVMLIINLIKSRKMMITVKTSDICGNCGPDILIFLSGGLVQSDI